MVEVSALLGFNNLADKYLKQIRRIGHTFKNMTNKQDKKMKSNAAELGSRGGKATAKKYGRKHMQKIGKMAAAAHWDKK